MWYCYIAPFWKYWHFAKPYFFLRHPLHVQGPNAQSNRKTNKRYLAHQTHFASPHLLYSSWKHVALQLLFIFKLFFCLENDNFRFNMYNLQCVYKLLLRVAPWESMMKKKSNNNKKNWPQEIKGRDVMKIGKYKWNIENKSTRISIKHQRV